MKQNYSIFDGIILAFLQGSITSEEKELLKGWINETPVNKEYFKQFYLVWKASVIKSYEHEDIDKAFQLIQLKIDETFKTPVIKKNFWLSRILYNYGRWAAVIIISLCIGAFLRPGLIRSPVSIAKLNDYHEINVPLGSKSSVHLPDGTEVILNAGSRLTYHNSYGNKLREVDLVGEGYFKVAKHPGKPFIVHTANANIKALGTEFNVKAYPEEEVIETILVKGSAEIRKISSSKQFVGKKDEETIVLKPGQKAKIYKESVYEEKNVEDQNTENAILKEKELVELKSQPIVKLEITDPKIETSWKENQWIIKGEDLENLAVVLSRHFDVDIRIKDQELLKYKFSGTIENETVEQVFNIMRLTIPISYTIDKGLVEVRINRSLEQKYQKAY